MTVRGPCGRTRYPEILAGGDVDPKGAACLAGVAAEVRLPAPDGAAAGGAALGRGHAVGPRGHAAVLRHQHDGQGGQEHHRVSHTRTFSGPLSQTTSSENLNDQATSSGVARLGTCLWN